MVEWFYVWSSGHKVDFLLYFFLSFSGVSKFLGNGRALGLRGKIAVSWAHKGGYLKRNGRKNQLYFWQMCVKLNFPFGISYQVVANYFFSITAWVLSEIKSLTNEIAFKHGLVLDWQQLGISVIRSKIMLLEIAVKKWRGIIWVSQHLQVIIDL